MGRQKSLLERRRGYYVRKTLSMRSQQQPSPSEASASDSDVVFRPSSSVVLPSSDVNIDFERRSKTRYGGFSMVTSIAHVWFNAFFEGDGPENDGSPNDSGVFEMEWEAMDGIKGSSRKGTPAFDKFAVVWRAVESSKAPSVVITEPFEDGEVRQTRPADWRGKEETEKNLGVRENDDDSENVSRASSVRSQRDGSHKNESAEALAGVRSDVTTSDQRRVHRGWREDFVMEQTYQDNSRVGQD